MEPVIYSQLVRNTGNNLNLNWHSELEGLLEPPRLLVQTIGKSLNLQPASEVCT